MPKSKRKDLKTVVPFTVYLTPAQIKKLERLAAAESIRQGRSMPMKLSEYVRALIDAEVET